MRLLAALLAAFAVATGTGLLVGVIGTVARRSKTPAPARRRRPRRPLPTAWAVAGVVIGFVTTQRIPLAMAGGFVGLAIGRWKEARRALRAAEEVRQAWPDGLRQITAMIRSGSSVVTALDELSTTGPEALRGVLAPFVPRSRVLGVVAALEMMRAEVADATTDRVVEVLILAHERGGAIVPTILDDLAVAAAADLQTADEIRTVGLEQRLNARIVFIVPWVMLLLLTARPGPYREFYSSSLGVGVIVVGAILSAGGAALVSRLGKASIEPRVLSGGLS